MIDKETFCSVIESLRQQDYIDNKFGENFKEMFTCGSRCSYDNGLLFKATLKLLQLYFPRDQDGFCRIEHYCLYIEFGRVQDKEIISAEDLYDELLIKQHQ
jgi:hypothetical protein